MNRTKRQWFLMPVLLLVLAFLPLLALAQVDSGAGAGWRAARGGSGGAPNVTIVYPGANFSNVVGVVANNTALQLGVGSYSVTPSVLTTNISSATVFTGATLANKTNITITGVYGQTIIDGSTSPGELLVITNCDQITLVGLRFRGYTNHNYTQIQPSVGGLFAGITVLGSSNLRFENCIIERHADHGIADGASGYLTYNRLSTNNVIVTGCTFEDIGGWRTNNPSYVVDGTAVVPTGWTVENCVFKNVFRGVEPYSGIGGPDQVFYNCVIRNNQFFNCVDFAISPAGSTNGHGVLVVGNKMQNDYQFSYHGTNYGSAQPSAAYGIFLNGGRGWMIENNEVYGGFAIGYDVQNSISGSHDHSLIGNSAHDLNPGAGFGAIGFNIGATTDSALAANSAGGLVMIGNRAYNGSIVNYSINSCRDCLIENNISRRHATVVSVDPLYAGFRIGSGQTTHRFTNVTFSGNIAIDGGAGTAYGFSFYPGAAGSNVVFQNNRAVGFPAGTAGITNNSGGTFTVVGSPIQARITFDLPSIAAAGQFQTNAALIGATTNTTFIVDMPLPALQGVETNLITTAWGSNNSVYVIFRNVSGIAVDAASREYKLTGWDTSLPGR